MERAAAEARTAAPARRAAGRASAVIVIPGGHEGRDCPFSRPGDLSAPSSSLFPLLFLGQRSRRRERALPILLPLLLALLAPTLARGADLPGPNLGVIREGATSPGEFAAGCVATTLNFVGVDAAAAALVAAKTNPTALARGAGATTIILPHLKAVDDCGNELPIALEATGFGLVNAAAAEAAEAATTTAPTALAPGGTLDLAAVPCGRHTVSYLAELQSGELLAVKDFTFEVECPSAA